MAQVRCPVCGKRFESSESPSPPFCGARCRQIDLGRWLGEGYSVPAEKREEDDEAFSAD
jgi:uncharacterized protein